MSSLLASGSRKPNLWSSARSYNNKAAGIPVGTKSLYDGSRETENCGVGMVASLHKIPSRKVFEDADEMVSIFS